MAFVCGPEISSYATIADFLVEFALGEGDLILSNRYIFDTTKYPVPDAQTIWQEDYGTGEPDEKMVAAIMGDMKPCKRIIGIGGGTVMDIAKLMALDVSGEDIYAMYTGIIPPVRKRELVLIPTTTGTGSEVTNVSVVAFPGRGVKLGLANAALYANKAILVPEFLKTLPYRPFIYASIDALVHAVEAFLSPMRDDFSLLFSRSAIHLLLEGFEKISQKGHDARFEMLNSFQSASCQAGIAFGNAGCGMVHAMSYAVGATFHIAHGEVNYALFAAVMGYYDEYCDALAVIELKRMLAEQLLCSENEAFVALDRLLNQMIPCKTLHEYGMTQQHIPVFCESVLEQQRLLKNSPMPMNAEKLARIFERAF